MAASVFDSALFRKLFPTGEVGRLFTDSAEVRAMVLVEGALAKAQGTLGVIPEDSAGAIHRASLEIPFDPGALAEATGQNGVSVPGLITLMRDEMNAPEHSAYLHWGATSQDIIDTGLMLRLRQALALIEDDLKALIQALATQAEAHAHRPMVARTLGQASTPTSWGAVLAQWGMPLLDTLEALSALHNTALWVSLSGASGTSSALGPKACETRAALAKALGLIDPERSWHSDRTPVLRILDWMMQISAILGSMGHSLIGLNASGIDEIGLTSAGASSTMPQKSNPVAPSALVALSHQATGLRASLQTAALHQHQRDGAAWFTEWMVLPQIVLSCASALSLAKGLAQDMRPKDAQMQASTAEAGVNLGLIHAEALSFALAAKMPRPEAQAATKELCQHAISSATPLSHIARAAHPDLPSALFDATAQMGDAPAIALRFAARARTCVT